MKYHYYHNQGASPCIILQGDSPFYVDILTLCAKVFLYDLALFTNNYTFTTDYHDYH